MAGWARWREGGWTADGDSPAEFLSGDRGQATTSQVWIGKGRCEPRLDFWTGLPCSGGCWMGSGQGGANASGPLPGSLAFVRKESRRVWPLSGPLAASASRYAAVEKENGRNAEE